MFDRKGNWHDSLGRFAKRPVIALQDMTTHEPWKSPFERRITYRACVTLNGVPIHSCRKYGKPNYRSFSMVTISDNPNIDTENMKKSLLKHIATYFHCRVNELWFEDGSYKCVFDIENPKPFNGSVGIFYEDAIY